MSTDETLETYSSSSWRLNSVSGEWEICLYIRAGNRMVLIKLWRIILKVVSREGNYIYKCKKSNNEYWSAETEKYTSCNLQGETKFTRVWTNCMKSLKEHRDAGSHTCDPKNRSFGQFNPFTEQITHNLGRVEKYYSNPSYEKYPHQRFQNCITQSVQEGGALAISIPNFSFQQKWFMGWELGHGVSKQYKVYT